MGTKGKDAFSNLIANIPGVDTSGFIKRTLNDLKTEHHNTNTPKQQSQTPTIPSSSQFKNTLNEKQASLPLSFQKDPIIDGLDDLLGINAEISKNTNTQNSHTEFEELFAGNQKKLLI